VRVNLSSRVIRRAVLRWSGASDGSRLRLTAEQPHDDGAKQLARRALAVVENGASNRIGLLLGAVTTFVNPPDPHRERVVQHPKFGSIGIDEALADLIAGRKAAQESQHSARREPEIREPDEP
jgi:hypothetical protein